MSERTWRGMPQPIAIALKIPDNAAFSALGALRRAGVPVARVERSEIYDDGLRTEARFNPNKHVCAPADRKPRAGEVFIEELGAPPGHRMAWRLFDESGNPVPRAVAARAAEALLCNPAIERAILGE